MALPRSNNFEGGTAGTTLTTANTGGTSGSAFDSVGTGGNTIAFNATSAHGSLGVKFVVAGASAASLAWTDTAATEWYTRMYVRLESVGGNLPILTMSTTGATRAYLRFTTARVLQLVNSAGTSLGNIGSALNLNQWYRIEVHWSMSTSGSADIRIYDGDSSIVLYSSTISANLISTAATVSFGPAVATGTGTASTFYLDDVGVSATGFIGPVGGNHQQLTSTVAATSAVTPTLRSRRRSTAAVNALGTLSVTPRARRRSTASIAASGSLSFVPRIRARMLWHAAGLGQITSALSIPPMQARIVAQGTFATSLRVRKLFAAAVAGSGQLTTTARARRRTTAQVAAAGTVHATARSGMRLRAAVAGSTVFSASLGAPGGFTYRHMLPPLAGNVVVVTLSGAASSSTSGVPLFGTRSGTPLHDSDTGFNV